MAHQTGNLPKKEETQQQLPTTAIQHYRLLQQQRRATMTTTQLTHLQKTDMKTTMSRVNQEDRVGSVDGRQVDQDEEVAEVEEEEEEEMKMENVEGTENIGTESTENVSSGDGDFSEVSTQKRTNACLNSAQDSAQNIAQDSGNKASTQPNIAQAVLIGVVNDSKQAQTQQLTGFLL
jgi:hypothetical protein